MKLFIHFYREEIWPVKIFCKEHGLSKWWLAGLVALAAIGLAGCKPSGAGVNHYETAAVARGDLVQHVTASGTLSAVVSVDVGSQVSGKISALYVDFNSPVKKGQLVAEIDPTVYEAAQQQAEGQLASAKADVTLKRQNLERKKILVPLKAASQLDLDQATAELAQAEATVVIQGKRHWKAPQANLGYCKITAPVDGVVISRKVDLGQTVNAAMNTPVLFTVAQDITKMNISAAFPKRTSARCAWASQWISPWTRFPTRFFTARSRKSANRRPPRKTW
jgi:HlyD family secretion protein